MSLQRKEINEREKAAIFYHVFGNVNDWRKLYKIADPTTDKKTDIKFLDTYVSRWKRSDKIQAFIKLVQEEKVRQQIEQRNKGKEEAQNQEQEQQRESKRTETQPENKPTKLIDYSDPKNRQHLYNRVIANASDDPKTQLDAAKMFEQIQRDDREAARAQKQSRVYLPLVCHECPLYNKAHKATTK